MFGGSTASYLARAPRIPLFVLIFIGLENKERFRLPGAGGEHFHCTVDPSPGHIRCRKIRLNPLSFLSLFFWNSLFFSPARIPCFFERFSLLFQGY